MLKIVFSPLLLHEKTKIFSKSITYLEINKSDQVELISTTRLKNLIHITSFDTNGFVQLIAQTAINSIAIKHRRFGI